MLSAILIGLGVGAIMGITGAGGGVLAVPALVAGLGLSMQQAAPVALLAIASAAGAGAIEGLRHGLVRYRAAMLVALVSLPFTLVGVSAAHALPHERVMQIFVIVMLITAVRSWRQSAQAGGHDATATLCALGPIHPYSGRFIWTATTAGVLGSIGAVTGFMAGLLGVGGGFIIVPMLGRFTQLSAHGRVATALLVIALISVGGVLSNLWHGVEMSLSLGVVFTLSAVSGMLASRRLAHFLSPAHVQRAFALLLLCVALGLGIQSLRS
ncbi:sulfite exporter TauE/SafE family protein [Viridibacterium curvum]|uniref:Probable membrane transporter protein n=1 Tax=Viridibacterium curvum TaxID=1101404 RepID=A0ABP9R4E3_9RHOO